MKIFLSYASEDCSVAEQIYYALIENNEVFFDRDGLKASDDYHAEIEAQIGCSDLVIFLISPHAVRKGKYSLAEVSVMQTKWQHPKGRLLPVLISPTPMEDIPGYIRSVTFLEPNGNIAFEVRHEVNKLRKQQEEAFVEIEDRNGKANEKSNSGVNMIILFLVLLGLAYVVYETDLFSDADSTEVSYQGGVQVGRGGKDVIKYRER